MYSNIDEYYYHEAIQHLSAIKILFENELGSDDISTAEAYMSFGLVCLKTGDLNSCIDHLQKTLMVYQNQLGEFDFKTKELDNLLRSLAEIAHHWFGD